MSRRDAVHLSGYRQRLEILLRNPRKYETRFALEAEAAIVGGIAEDDAPHSAEDAEIFKAALNQHPSNPAPLICGEDGDGPKTIPIFRSIADDYRREGDVTHDVFVIFRHQRNRQLAVGSQLVDDCRLLTAGMLDTSESSVDQATNMRAIFEIFSSDLHF